MNVDNESWRNILRKMAKDELLLILYEHECYLPEFCSLVEEVLRQKYGVTEEELTSIPQPDNIVDGEVGTRNLFLEVLTKMGCGKSIEFNSDSYEDDGECRFSFSYQDNCFDVSAFNDNIYVWIEKCCGIINGDDKEETERVEKAINQVNGSRSVTMYHKEDERLNCVYVECRVVLLLIPMIPNLTFYIASKLSSLVKAEQLFNSVVASSKKG